jgi:hypothetical protein
LAKELLPVDENPSIAIIISGIVMATSLLSGKIRNFCLNTEKMSDICIDMDYYENSCN